jgi:peptide/nickel transport system substrate-binding protein
MNARKIVWTLLALLTIFSMVLAACATETAAPVVEEEPVVEEPAAEEPAAEEPAAEEPAAEEPAAEEPAMMYTIKDPVPYPDPNELDLGGGEAIRLPIDQIFTYKALPEYNQPEWMDALVADGTLPPVEERLPKEPQVVLTSGMPDGIGVYGDVWRGFSACPTAGYNNMAGVSMGWFGIESYTTRYNALVETGPLYRVDQDIEPLPGLAKSWEWSADGKQLTFNLIEGAKWSDGEPFTADDVMFTWEGYVLDENVNSSLRIDALMWDGVATTLEKVDDFTVTFTFPVEKPLSVYYLLDEENFIIMPEHQLKALHPKWSETPTDYKAFENALAPVEGLPIVTMGPWVITEYKVDELMIMRRNPYFWKVDENGNQLPYMDEIQYVKGPSGAGRDLCVMAGNCDQMNLENPSTFVEAMTKAQEPDATFEVYWGPETLGYALTLNLSLDFGVANERDAAMRELLRDLRFRRALSHATDRDGITQAIMKGPFLRAWAGGLYPGAPEFDKESVVYYDYDVDSAKGLLAEIGLEDTDGNGVLNWTEGPMAGEDVILSMTANEDQREAVNIAEALVNQYAAVGIQVNYRTVTSTARSEVEQQGTWETHVSRMGQNFALPHTRIIDMAPISSTFGFHREGETPRVLQPFEQELVDIALEYRDTFDADKRKELMFEYNQIFTENLYDVGILVGRYGLGLAKRSQNVPPATPAFMYTWVEDAISLEMLWTPLDMQFEQNRPNTLPEYP